MNLMMLLEMAAAGFGDRVAVQMRRRRADATRELFAAAGAAARRVAGVGLRARRRCST